MKATGTAPDHACVRERFPALAGDTVFLENAGGSQVPACVADRMYRYMTETYVQLGASYPLSQMCTETVEAAHDFARIFVNAGDGEAILGPSSTALLNMLAECYGRILEPGDRIILAETGHEANLGPWKRLESVGVEMVWWHVDPVSHACSLDDLVGLLDERTVLVALPHVSNLLGGIVDLKAVTTAAHAVGARVVADGVAFAPHRAIDVRAWDVDWYVYSTYKVYGPHMAVLYGKREALGELVGPNHFFIPDHEVPYKFEPGGANHEACAGLLGLGEYLNFLAGVEGETDCARLVMERAFDLMREWEEPLIDKFLAYLEARPDVRLIGPTSRGPERVGTISFVHAGKSAQDIVAAVDHTGIAIRHGHMYAYHLCEALGLNPVDGVVRVSLVHYNTSDEIDRLIVALDEIL